MGMGQSLRKLSASLLILSRKCAFIGLGQELCGLTYWELQVIELELNPVVSG